MAAPSPPYQTAPDEPAKRKLPRWAVITFSAVAGVLVLCCGIGLLTNKSQTPDGSPTAPAPSTTQPAAQPSTATPSTPSTPDTPVTTTTDPAPPEPAATTADDSTDQPSTSDGGDVYYANCAAVRAAGKAPLLRGQPGYRPALDRDHDGIACE
jgi:hypothetical protein